MDASLPGDAHCERRLHAGCDALQAFTEEAHSAGLEYFKAWYATDPDRQLRR